AGWFFGQKFQKLGKRPTQSLIHNSKPLTKKAAPTPRDNQIERISGFEIPVSFLLYGAHFVTCPVCQVRVGALRVRYTSRPWPVRRRGKQSAAVSAVVVARRGGNGGLLILRRFASRPRICGSRPRPACSQPTPSRPARSHDVLLANYRGAAQVT